jgi:CheY-like chemotaxis protein
MVMSREPEAVDQLIGKGETALVVEDDTPIRRIVVRYFRELGYHVIEAKNAAEAMSCLESDAVDIMFTDVVMPGAVDGLELARQASDRWPDLRVILTSGFPQSKLNDELSQNRFHLLSKPYRRGDLARILQDELARERTGAPALRKSMSKVLVIDDDPAARRMIARILTETRFEVVEAANGVDGMRKFRAETPDLVITDIIMPEQEGIQTISEIRGHGSKTAIIAISGGGSGSGELYLSMAEELGANGVLAKPFRPSDLLALVDQVLSLDPLDRSQIPATD